MTEIDETFSVVEGSFKSSVKKWIPILYLLIWKTTESILYDVVRTY